MSAEMEGTFAALKRREPTFAELFTPKLITILREGYGLKDFRADAIAGLTVAVVALPLSMAIAIASGVGPERGLYTAIIGGFLVSALGGSRFQIGGPAGAFIVLIAAIVERQGYDGLVLATLLAGLILMTVGLFRLGTYLRSASASERLARTGTLVFLTRASISVRRSLLKAGLHKPLVRYAKTSAQAAADGRSRLQQSDSPD